MTFLETRYILPKDSIEKFLFLIKIPVKSKFDFAIDG